MLLPHDRYQMICDTAQMPDGREEQIGLTAICGQARNEAQQLRRSRDLQGQPLVDL